MVTKIEDLKEMIEALERMRKGTRVYFEEFIQDATIPLDKRWELFLEAPDELSNQSPWVWRFENLDQFYTPNPALEKWEQDMKKIDFIDELMEAIYYREDTNRESIVNVAEQLDLHIEESEIPLPHEITDVMREELLQKNLKSFVFDW